MTSHAQNFSHVDLADALLKASTDAIALLDARLLIVSFNPRFLNMGDSKCEALGMHIDDFLLTNDNPSFFRSLISGPDFQRNGMATGQVSIRLPDLKSIPVQVLLKRTANGDASHILLMASENSDGTLETDHSSGNGSLPIKDPGMDNEKLQLSQTFLTSLLNSAFFGVSSFRPIYNRGGGITDFRIVYTNDEVPANFGLTMQQVTGRTCSEVYPGLFTNGIFNLMASVADTGVPATYEIDTVVDGKVIWFTAAIEKSGEHITVISKNITNEKLATLELEKLNTLLENKNRELEHRIVEELSASYASYTFGKSFFDALILEISRKTNADLILIGKFTGTHDVECLAVCKNGTIAENFRYKPEWSPCQLLSEGSSAVFPAQCLNVFPDSELITSHQIEGYVGCPILDEKGKPIALISAMCQSEIAEHQYIMSLLKIAAKRCELEFERINKEQLLAENVQKLQLQNKELASFTYIASHDLQEPLRKIRMFMSRLLSDSGQVFSDSSVAQLSGIAKTVDRMQTLIDDLLYYSKAEAGTAVLKTSDLNFVVHDVLQQMEDSITEKNAIITFDELPQIKCIGQQVAQIFTNMISNSLKYSDAARTPEIRISSTRAGENGAYWKIDIQDNGIGFDMRYKDKIFEVFQRLHGRMEYAGTGVGLAICKKIMEQHGGYISVDSTEGQGTVFSLYFKA